ncbi:hypothetical protein D3C86_1116960 [compost metagenome]
MAQGHALGPSRGAAGELDVDRVVAGQGRLDRLKQVRRGLTAQGFDGVETDGPRQRRRLHLDDQFQVGQAAGVEACWGYLVQLRRQGADQGRIVAGLERRRQDQGAAADLLQRIFQLVQPIGGIDGGQDQASFRGGELGDDPFDAVHRPDADPVAGAQARGQQAGGEIAGAAVQRAPCQANVLRGADDGLVVAPLPGRLTQRFSDRVGQKGGLGGALNVTGHVSEAPAGARFPTWAG